MPRPYTLKQLLKADLIAVNMEPTLKNLFFKIWASPGFAATVRFRLSAYFRHKGLLGRFLAKLLWKRNYAKGLCDISPLAQIGPGLFLPHPVGVVIGDGVIIGGNATICQHSSIGFRNPESGVPVIGDGVTFYACANVTGALKIGSNSIIGANAVVLSNIPASAIAVGVPARVIPRKAQ